MSAGPPSRDALLADVVARREQLAAWKRRARSVERIGGLAVAIVAAVGFRIAWTGGVLGMVMGASSWILTAVVFVIALTVTRGAVATVAARRLVPARRDLAAAESRLHAHDRAHGR